MTDDRPTVGELFAGIGGIGLGLERAGFRVAWHVEIDPFCAHILAERRPGVPTYTDIRELDFGTVAGVDVLAGGFPCQPVSIAGLKQAQDDPRWLWPHFARAIRDLRPRYVLVENVRNLLTANRGTAFGEVVGDLAALGYDAEWDCIPASAVGAPHQRDRLWLVAARTEHPGPVADADDGDPERPLQAGRDAARDGREAVADADGPGRGEHRGEGPVRTAFAAVERGRAAAGEWWAVEPDVGRVAHGVPARVDRLRALGNAVVPPVVEVIGQGIYEAICADRD